MRNKIIILTLTATFLTTTPSLFAQGVHTPGTGLVSPTLKAENQGTGLGLSTTPTPSLTPTQDQTHTQDQDRLRIYLQDQDRLMTQDRDKLQTFQQTIYKDQDRTRLTTQLLIKAQQTVSGLDPKVNTLASQIQSTLQTTLAAEEQIRTRSMFTTFFMGGDKNAATQIQQVTTQNQARIRELQQLLLTCTCSEQVRTMLQQQIQTLQQEQTRLQQLAQQELAKKGLFSFFSSNS